MIIDPVEVLEMLPTTIGAPQPTNTGVSPIPSVIPDLPEWQKATGEGYRTLWVVFVLFVIASIGFVALSWTVPVSKRLFHILTSLVAIIAAVSYFGMATRHAVTWHHIRERQPNNNVPDVFRDIFRQVFWARYVDWALTTPLLLLNLSFLAGLSGAHTLITVSANLIMVLTALFSRFGREETPQKWGWFVIALIAYLTIVWQLVYNGRSAALARGSKVGNFYTLSAGYLLVVLTAYPVIWGVVQGQHLSVNKEIIAYAVLDLLAKGVFGGWLLFSYSRTPEANVELGGVWAYGIGSTEGRLRLVDDEGA